MKHTFIWLLFLFTASAAHAQHQEVPEKPKMWKGSTLDTTSGKRQLLSIFKDGTLHGHFRYYFSHTNNEGALTDYYANAIGGGLRFETAKFYGFQFAVSGFYIFNIGSSDMTLNDSITNQPNRYEIGLFDVQNPGNKKDMDRLEELHMKYTFRKSHIIVGRQLLNTPFINLQDGRMRPTGVEGVYLEVKEWKRFGFEGGYLWSISPRSTVDWFGIGESFGVYPVGLDANGNRSDYLGNTLSHGIGQLGIHAQPLDWLKIHAWDVLIDNVQNTAFLQADMNLKVGQKDDALIAGFQFTRQDAVGQGGNADPDKAYREKGSEAMVFGGRVGWKNKRWTLTGAYNRITAHGRFLSPREWGRDPFYTFMPRERNEGFGDVHAVVGKIQGKFPKAHLNAYFAAGHFWLPDANDFALNKYAMPSYAQLNFDLRYNFSGFLKGLDLHLLLVGKIRTGDDFDNPRFVFNKVNMFHGNLVVNYHF
jgi:hypothetical protein